MANNDPSIAKLKEVVAANPNDLEAARELAGAILRDFADSEDVVERRLAEIRNLRRRFPSDEKLALLHAMAVSNAAREAVADNVLNRNAQLLEELRTIKASVNWNEESISGFDIGIMGMQYTGLLWQRRYDEAENQLAEMSKQGFDGTFSERLEWLTALRPACYILIEQEEFDRAEKHIELVREYRRRHPDDDYEAPVALLAMLLRKFEAAERRGETQVADIAFEEAYSLHDSTKHDSYGHAKRLYCELTAGRLGEPARAASFAERLAAGWPYVARKRKRQ